MDILDCMKNYLSGKIDETVLNEAIQSTREEYGGKIQYVRTDRTAYIRQMLNNGADHNLVMKKFGLKSEMAIRYHLRAVM